MATSVFATRRNPTNHTLSARASLETLRDTVQPFEAFNFGEALYGKPLIADIGQVLQIEVQNQLQQPTSVHWHGLRVQNHMDGVARFGSPLIQPGAAMTYEVPCKDAGLYWFHSHHNAVEQIGKGLYGTVLVKAETAPPILDQVIVLDDWPVETDTAEMKIDWQGLNYSSAWSHDGLRGRLVTVNGSALPKIEIPRQGFARYRLLNAATDRVFRPSFKGAKSWLVAIDGFDIEPFECDGAYYLGPGQRLDFLVESEASQVMALALGEDMFAEGKLLKLHATDIKSPEIEVGDILKSIKPWQPEELTPGKVVQKHVLNLTSLISENAKVDRVHWLLNGKPNNDEQAVFTAKQDETIELWLENQTSFNHVMHFHGQHVKVVENSTVPWENGRFRDSVSFPSRGKAVVQLKASNKGKWPLHCHMVTHQMTGMNAWFEIV